MEGDSDGITLAIRPRPGKHVSDQAGMVTAGSPVLVVGQRVIQKIRLTTGVGEPEDGRRFVDGAQRFRSAGRAFLNSAYSGDSWDGAASVAYTGQTDHVVGAHSGHVRRRRPHGLPCCLARPSRSPRPEKVSTGNRSGFGDMTLTTAAAGRSTACRPGRADLRRDGDGDQGGRGNLPIS